MNSRGVARRGTRVLAYRRGLAIVVVMGSIACGENGSATFASVSQAYDRSTVRFGLHCPTSADEPPNSYQTAPGCTFGWRGDFQDMDLLCQYFTNSMVDVATLRFWKDLHGKKSYWEGEHDGDLYSLEDVDLFFAATHGVAAPHPALDGCPGVPADSGIRAKWAMWDNSTYVSSRSMGLGNERRGTSFFVTYSCQSAVWDGYTWDRYYPIFSKGLRMALGMAESFYWFPRTTDQLQHGANFAYYVRNNHPVAFSWLFAFDDNDGHTMSPSVIATGSTYSECKNRRETIRWTNFLDSGYPRITDSDIAYMCGYQWMNID